MFGIWNATKNLFGKGPFPTREDAEAQIARFQASRQDVRPDRLLVVEIPKD